MWWETVIFVITVHHVISSTTWKRGLHHVEGCERQTLNARTHTHSRKLTYRLHSCTHNTPSIFQSSPSVCVCVLCLGVRLNTGVLVSAQVLPQDSKEPARQHERTKVERNTHTNKPSPDPITHISLALTHHVKVDAWICPTFSSVCVCVWDLCTILLVSIITTLNPHTFFYLPLISFTPSAFTSPCISPFLSPSPDSFHSLSTSQTPYPRICYSPRPSVL